MVQSSILGFPRMGVNRDLKKATEAYWGGKLSQAELLSEAKRLRLEHWNIQKKAGVDVIPSNDFALYDQVLTHIQDFGVSLAADPEELCTILIEAHIGRPREIYASQPRPY
jgi:5-methyltetrahydropteroyltriglutamate--homocysteine methyltransferase